MKWTILFFSVILIIPYVFSSNTTVVDDKSDPLISGLEPFFKLTNGFIKLIYSKSIVEFMFDELNIKIDELKTVEQADKAYDELTDSIRDWKKPINYFTPILACLALGILSIVVMLITGFVLCCTCCCRKCCCRSRDEYPSSKDKPCRIVCGLLFFCFVTMILAGSVLGFLANKAIHNQLDPRSSDGAISQIKGHLKLVDEYMDDVLVDVDKAVDKILITEVDRLIKTINELPKAVEEKFRTQLKIDEVTKDALDLNERMKIISTGLTFFEGERTPTNNLQVLITEFNNLVTTTSCNDCPSFDGASLPNLETAEATIKNIVQDLSSTIDANFKNGTKNVTEESSRDMEQQITELLGEVDKIRKSVQGKKSQLEENYKDLQKPIGDVINDLEDDSMLNTIDTIKNIIFYVGIGLCSIGALICLLYYIGLLSGCCGAAPNEGSCNRSVGGNFLVSGITFTFLFFEILMIILIILFTIGTFFRGEICRPLTPTIEESDSIENLNKLIRLGMLRGNSMNITIDLKFSMTECKKNKPIYEAFDLDKIVDLKKILKFTEYNFEELINKAIESIKNNSKPSVIIWNNDMEKAYVAIKAAKIEDITTGPDWKNKIDLAILKKSEKANDFKDWINRYETLHNNLIKHDNLINEKKQGMDAAWDNLKTKTKDIEDSIPGKLVVTMEVVVKGALQPFLNFTQTSIDTLVKAILGLGKCNNIYRAIQGSVDTLCPKTVDPYNAFWFSLGWQLFFMIPAFIVAIVLNNLYRKQEDEEDGFDDFKPYVQHDNAAYNPHPTSPHHAHPPPSYNQQYQTPPNAPAHYAHNNVPQQQFGY